MKALVTSCIVTALPLTLAVPRDGAAAQSYPAKPVRLVTEAAGAGGDLVSRVVATGLTEL